MYKIFNKNFFVKQSFLVAFIFIFYFITRLSLLWRYGDRAFGYDTGIYRHYIDGYWSRFGDPGLQPLAFSWFSNFFKFFGFSTDTIIYTIYFLLGCALFWLVYFLVKKYFDAKTALYSIFLFSISIVQFEFFWWYYYRSFLAIVFLLLAILLFHYKNYFAILPLVLAFCFHPLSALPVLLAVFMMIILDKDRRRYWSLVLVVTIIGSFILNWREFFGQFLYLQNNSWQAGFDKYGATESTGQFISGWFFLRAVIFYVIFGLLGLCKYYKKQKLLSLVFFFSLLICISQIIFYRRLFVWLDLCLIIFAGAFIADWVHDLRQKKIFRFVGILFVILILFINIRYVYSKQPLITEIELAEIKIANDFGDSNFVLSYSSHHAPWLYGFTSKNIIAPGMFENNLMTFDEWMIFWQGENKEKVNEILSKYSEPVYIFVGEGGQYWGEQLVDNKKFIKINKYWYKFFK